MDNLLNMMQLHPHALLSHLSLIVVSSLSRARAIELPRSLMPAACWRIDHLAATALLDGQALPLRLVTDTGRQATFDRPARPLGEVSATGAFKVRLEEGEFVRAGAVYRIDRPD